MWGEYERRNEWKFKNIRMERKQNNQNNKDIIGGNFFIISRIINWVISQFLNINSESGSRTPALSKVEFIVTGAAVAMFSIKLMFLLYLSSVVPGISFGMYLYVDGFLTMVSS